MDTCRYCQGQLEETLISHVQHYHGHWYLLENVPALVCRQCGETYFTPQTHSRILHRVRDAGDPVRMESLAVFDLRP